MKLYIKNLRSVFKKIRNYELSMQRRFAVYLIALTVFIIAAVLFMLGLFGVLNPADRNVRYALNHNLDNAAAQFELEIYELSSYSDSMSEHLSSDIDKYLDAKGLTFEDLSDNPSALTGIQASLYRTLYDHMKFAPCSGAFYMLDQSVSTGQVDRHYSGLYLKYSNIYSESTIDNKVCLYRGSSSVARENGINLHSTWQLEMSCNDFECRETLSKAHNLSPVCPLPDTWENVRWFYTPLRDSKGRLIGVCGFEISSLFYRLSHSVSEAEYTNMAAALLTETDSGYTGQISGNRSGFSPAGDTSFKIDKYDDSLKKITYGDTEFVGMTKDVSTYAGTHTVAAMLPKSDYEDIIYKNRITLVIALFIFLLLAFGACIWLSRKYAAPIINDLELLKSEEYASEKHSSIPEINDLFVYLSQKDKERELAVEELNAQMLRAKAEYEKAKAELEKLSPSILPEEEKEAFGFFISNLNLLTNKEKEIFDLYLKGYSSKEILAVTNISENTLKYHNRNIYSKLGVSSRKQMLRYAEYMKSDENRH